MSNKNSEIQLTKKPGIFSQLHKVWAMAYYSFRAQLRNPATFAFGFIFPIVFISVFGLISSGGGVSVKLGIPDGQSEKTPVYQTLEKIKSIKINRGQIEYLRSKLTKGQIDGIILVESSGEISSTPNQSGYKVTLEISNANPQTAGVVSGLVSGVVDKLNLGLSGVKQPPIEFQSKQVSGREFRYIDFALPGQIGFALLSTAIFGTAFGLIFLKKTLVLKRIFATPTRPLSIILGQGLARLIVALLQALIILGFGVFVFKFHLANGFVTFIEMLLLSGLGLLVFLGFGLFISGISSDENSVAPLANLLTLPQFLLSGTFFSTDLFPSWVKPIADHLPLTYLNEAMRKVATEGASLEQIIPNLVALVIWGVIAYLLAARTFKWQ